MKSRLLSVLLVFLLVASVSIPAVSAEPSHVYHELHNLCLCEESEDLGRIYGSWGVGYEAWIDKQTDNWKVFVHAGLAKKEFTITPETDLGKLVALRDFVNSVDECKEESDQIPTNILDALVSGTIAAGAFVLGGLFDNAYVVGGGALPAGVTIEEVRQATTHFNNAKNAQKNAEKLFGEL